MSARVKTKLKLFNMRMRRKLAVLFFLVLLAFVGLGVRIYAINRDNGEEYKKQVLSQQAYDSKVLDFKRGAITDAKGTILADSELVYDVIVDAKEMLREDYYFLPSMQMLGELGVDTEKVEAYVRANPESQYYVALRNLPYKEKVAYDEKMRAGKAEEDAKKLKTIERVYSNVKGIWFDAGYIRNYPNGSLASDVIGFTNGNNDGIFGLEEFYNDTLNGRPGREYGYLDEMSTLERTTIPATDGNNLVSTLDANIQAITEKYLKQYNNTRANYARPGNGANNVGAIVMDVNKGEILAMASYPGFDLNNPYERDVLVGMSKLNEKDSPTYENLTQEEVDALSDQDLTRYLNALWKNFCISDYYEPGSVAKLLTVASGLESGKMTGNEGYYCDGALEVGDWTIHCHNWYGDGYLTVGQAVEVSCNVALMQMAFAQGKETFTDFQNVFNLGLKTNIDLAGEARTDGFVYKAADMGQADLATNSFGQNYNVTMIQMASAFASLINGGYYYEPHLVSRITSANGSTVQNIEPRILKKTVSEETSAKIREYCKQVVIGENGTGKTARPAGYIIGGKTGTAETYPRDNKQYVVSFMGYAPADDPQIMVYVVVDRPNIPEQDDSKEATRLVRQIFTEVLPYLGIHMTEPLSAEEEAELAQLQEELKTSVAARESAAQENEGETPAGTDDGLGNIVAPENIWTDPDTGVVWYARTEETVWTDVMEWHSWTNPDTGITWYTVPEGGYEETASQEAEQQAEETEPVWTSYAVDPETGFYIDPNGGLIDPETGTLHGVSTMGDASAPPGIE